MIGVYAPNYRLPRRRSRLPRCADLPRVDLHVHIDDDAHPDQSLTPAQATAISRKLGVRFGVLAEGGCGGDIRDGHPGVEFPDPQDFVDRYVDFTARVLSQPIQVWANPTYLPESLQSRYDALWTPARMDRLIAAAVKNGIAIEINAKFRIPSLAFIQRAKAAGAKFSIGSNQHVHGIGEIDYCLRIAKEAGLTEKDIYVPARPLK